MKIIKFLFSFFKKSPSNRLYVKDVNPGDNIRIEWSRMKGGIGYVTCLNNDPFTKKIFL